MTHEYFYTYRLWPSLVWTAVVWLTAFLAITALSRAPQPPPMHMVAQPNCFPAWTWGAKGFLRCPDGRELSI